MRRLRPVGPGTRLALSAGMAEDKAQKRAAEIVTDTLTSDELADVERMLVLDAVVVRKGNHFRIESGGDDPLRVGRCDCGERLIESRCKICGRHYSASA